MFCKKCGKKIENDSQFCSNCGKSILKIKELKTTMKTVVKNTTEDSDSKDLKGLGGWLSIVGLSLFFLVFNLLNNIYTDVSLFNDGTVDSANEVIQGYSGLLTFEIIGNIALLALAIYTLYLYFKKKVKFPKYYIYLLIANVIFVFVDYFMMSSATVYDDTTRQVIDDTLSGMTTDMWQVVISSVIWISYMKKSKRVKATFIEN